MKLIGLIGNAGSGKDTVASVFKELGYNKYAFADAVKQACSAAFGIPIHHFEHRGLKESLDPYWNISPRQMLQFVGTELFRNHTKELCHHAPAGSFWIQRMWYNFIRDFSFKEDVRAVISDCRFKDECDFVLSNNGLIIHLTRPGYDGNVGITGHASEYFAAQLKETYGEDHAQIVYLNNTSSVDSLKYQAALLYQTHSFFK